MNKDDLNLSNLNKCIESLKECLSDYKKNYDEKIKEYISDSCIKRFEYTVETSWKVMKRYLKLQYGKTDKELTMNNIFRYMEGYGLITSWDSWKNYYNNRNNTSHEYNQEKASEILSIAEKFLVDAEEFYNNLSKALNS
ncbi:HI0074 family nucleotidyltransferase substrate-binding subunit [bacterium]|nr:HI0074 family nucleotidyltransferase substrate-binding subunit [bacterium]